MIKKVKSASYEKIVLIAFMLLPALAISPNYDNDFWFLLNHGRYIVENGFPLLEPFTIHADWSFLIQQWLFDVIIYYLHAVLGKAGVLGFVYLCSFVILFITYKICMLISENKFILSVLVSTVCYLIMCVWYMVSRPQVITYIVLLTELYVLERYALSGERKYLVALPVLSVVLINAHAAMWWMVFAILCPHLAESIIEKFICKKQPQVRLIPLVITVLCMLAVGLINPYGFSAVLYVFRSFGDATINASIMEMCVPDIKGLNGAVFYVFCFAVVVCYVLNRQGSFRLRYIFLSMGTTVLALMAIKSIAYFAIGTLIPLAYYMRNIAHNLVFSTGEKRNQRGLVVAFLVCIVLASAWVTVDSYDTSKDYPPCKAAVDYLKENQDAAQVVLYTGFYDGGYAQYSGFKTYIDPRAEVFLKANNKKKDVFQEYIALQKGLLHYQEFLSRYAFTHILVTEDDILDVYLSKDQTYVVYYEDSNSKIYIKNQLGE